MYLFTVFFKQTIVFELSLGLHAARSCVKYQYHESAVLATEIFFSCYSGFIGLKNKCVQKLTAFVAQDLLLGMCITDVAGSYFLRILYGICAGIVPRKLADV